MFFAQICSHSGTTLANPGIPHKNYYLSEEVIDYLKSVGTEIKKTQFEFYKICRTCNILITWEHKVNHCDICGICILGINF